MRFKGLPAEEAIEAGEDIFRRDPFADGLLNLFDESDDSLVVALDEPWGNGKTVFCKRLQHRAGSRGYRTVYFDAFKRDYEPDVFIALTATLLEMLPETEKAASGIKDAAVAVGKAIGRVGLKTVVRAATAGLVKLTDIEEEIVGESSESAVAGALAAGIEDELNREIDRRLSNVAAEDQAFCNFRQSLFNLTVADSASDSKESIPLIFIVDELDRCRPDYALEVLETIKHFYSVPNVHFLIAIDYTQIVGTVEQRYGLARSGDRYLEKFIDVRTSFPVQRKHERERSISHFVKALTDGLPVAKEDPRYAEYFADFLSRVALRRAYSLRLIEKIYAQFAICMTFTNSRQLRVGAIVFVLCDLNLNERNLFLKAKSGNLTFKEISRFYGFDEAEDRWYIDWLRYLYDPEVNHESDQWSAIRNSLFQYSVGDIASLRSYFANDVVDRITGS